MTTVDPASCPLCGAANLCAQVAKDSGSESDQSGQTPCWCFDVSFSPAVLQRVPVEAKNKACICEKCAKGLALAKEVQ